MIMENRLEKMGNELTTMLGFENDTVIAYWQAFEGRRASLSAKKFIMMLFND